MPFPTSSIVTGHGPLLTSLIHCACFPLAWPVFAVLFLGHLLTCLQPQSSYAKMSSPSKAGQTKNYSHSKLVLKWNNVSPTSIQSSAHLRSSPSMVHFPETYSDDEEEDDEEDEDDEDDVIITSGLQHSLKIRNYASASSSPNATHDYDNNDDDASSSSNHSTVGGSSGGVSNDNYEDNDDDAEDANHEANNDDANDANDKSSICDGTHSKEDYSNEEDNDYSFAYASSSPCTTMSNNRNAVGGTSNAINDSNNHNAVGGSDDDIMSLSCTNQSLQPNVSASDSSSFIGPCCNPKRNARSKVKRYDIREDSSDGENKCSSSDECVSSVGGGSRSITSKPDSFKSITKLSFNGVSRQPVLG